MNKKTLGYIILFSIAVAILASFFASSSPDGLEKVAETLGFIESEEGTFGIFSDYSLITGIIGLFIMYGLFKGISILYSKTSK